ncbi:RNA-directed DNA polymerase, eukaryota, reverse transcriptase zinc-binding domain protein [Tanacetum coccineum]
MDRVEQIKVPLWVTLVNILMEAWSTECISSLASILGKLLIMDNMTARRCQFGEGMMDFARVLVEFDVVKAFKEKIEIQYKDMNNNKCQSIRYGDRKQYNEGRFYNMGTKINDVKGSKGDVWKKKEVNEGRYNKSKNKGQKKIGKSKVKRKWKDDCECFPNKKIQPNFIEVKSWTQDMIRYFKDQWKIDRQKEAEEMNGNIEDVLEVNSRIAKELSTEEVAVEDVNCSRLLFTWIKSPSKPETSIMKKLDRVMANSDFLDKYGGGHARFHPFLIYDHSSVMMHIPNSLERKNKSFRFSNFIADKNEFIYVVKREWNCDCEGYNMYKLVKKMKNMKITLNKLAWKNGNLFQNVKKLEDELKKAQVKGNWFEGDNVADQFVKHFEKFLGNNGETDQIDSSDDLFNNKLSKMKLISWLEISLMQKLRRLFLELVIDIKKKRILEVMSFAVGKLPMKYLGVPLITKNIGISEYNQLVERVKQKVNDWKNKALSYAERLQLIVFVMASMHIYWASISLIPKTTVKEIEKALKGFLWCQGDMKRGAAKVAWKVICAPKSQGGLGIKRPGPWNEALLCKHLWNVIVKKESLWVKWVNVVKLKGKSIWEVDIDDTDSGTWKAMPNLRSKIKDSVWKKIGDGKNTNVWFDKWCDESPLCEIIPFRKRYEARLSEKSNVVDMIVNGEWIWPNEWRIQNGKSGKFSIRSVWENFKEVKTDVSWHKVVWYAQCNPRYAFILWLAMHKRLATQDRIMAWTKNSHLLCPLGKKENDSHEHLFFKCPFSEEVWNNVKSKLKRMNWDND